MQQQRPLASLVCSVGAAAVPCRQGSCVREANDQPWGHSSRGGTVGGSCSGDRGGVEGCRGGR